VPLYVSLIRATQKGAEELRDLGKRYEDTKKSVEKAGGMIHSAYALFGRYDYMVVLEFPSEKEAAHVLAKAATRGTARFETLTAMPMADFIRIAQEV